jgi:hypothetical protein
VLQASRGGAESIHEVLLRGAFIDTRKMWRIFITISLVVGVGCTTRVRYEYFEPSGLGVTESSPPEAPKNVATVEIQGSSLSIWSHVTAAGEVEVGIRVEVPSEKSLRFRGKSAVVMVDNAQEEIPLGWIQWRGMDGIGEEKDLPFDSLLQGRTFRTRPPKTGSWLLGRYDCTFHLPARYADTREFSVLLPVPEGTVRPLAVRFVRKAADFRTHVQLQ